MTHTDSTMVLESTLGAYREEYRELSESSRHLEGKAQGTAAISGIFIAAVFAFVQAISSITQPVWTQALLVTALVFLVIGVLLAVLALRVREVAAPPLGKDLETLVTDFLEIEDEGERQNRLPNLIRDQIGIWREVNEQVHEVNKNKAAMVLWSQALLVLSVGAVSILTILVIVGCIKA